MSEAEERILGAISKIRNIPLFRDIPFLCVLLVRKHADT